MYRTLIGCGESHHKMAMPSYERLTAALEEISNSKTLSKPSDKLSRIEKSRRARARALFILKKTSLAEARKITGLDMSTLKALKIGLKQMAPDLYEYHKKLAIRNDKMYLEKIIADRAGDDSVAAILRISKKYAVTRGCVRAVLSGYKK